MGILGGGIEGGSVNGPISAGVLVSIFNCLAFCPESLRLRTPCGMESGG